MKLSGAARKGFYIASGVLFAVAGVAAFMTYTYQQYDTPTMTSRTVVSALDIPNASLSISQVGALTRYTVTIPSEGPLSGGTYLVQIVFGNPTTGAITRVAYGAYGSQARIGGPAPLNGTGGVIVNAQTSAFVASAGVSYGTNSLNLDVDPNSLNGTSLLFAEVHGTDSDIGLGADEMPDWDNIPSKILRDNLPNGGIVMPAIPGALEPTPPFGEGPIQGPTQKHHAS